MNKHLSDKFALTENGGSPKPILANWLEAAANFHLSYTQLITHVKQRIAKQDLRTAHKRHIGQCPVGQLLMMVIRMRRELEKLTQDMDQGGCLQKLPTRKKYNKLATHTLRLNHLNYQAKLRLDLDRLSMS